MQYDMASWFAASTDETVNEQQACTDAACAVGAAAAASHPMVVMKLGVNESSEKRSSRQLLPTPAHATSSSAMFSTQALGKVI